MEFSFNAHGFVYHSGLADIRRAFDATMVAMDALVEDKILDKQSIVEKIAAGKMEEAEYDSEGNHVVDHVDMCDFRLQKAKDSANFARTGYVLILYHYWEKSCFQWVFRYKYKLKGSPKYDADEAYEWLKDNNVPFDKDGIQRMRILSNFIKHENTLCCKKYPEYFVIDEEERESYRVILSDDLRLTNQHLLDMFDILERSGYSIHG